MCMAVKKTGFGLWPARVCNLAPLLNRAVASGKLLDLSETQFPLHEMGIMMGLGI